MHRQIIMAAALCSFVSPSLDAQQQCTLVPSVASTVPQATSANAFPWLRSPGQQIRVLHQFGASNFASVGHPIFIQKLRFRAYDTSARTWAGGTYANVKISMSTGVTSYTAIDQTFANNHGTDLKVVYQGPVDVLPGSHTGTGPGPFYIEIDLAAPGFAYNPGSGSDVCIDIQHDGSNTGVMQSNYTATYNTTHMPAGSRVYHNSDMNAAVGSGITINYAPAMEMCWIPQKGLFASFRASPTSGPANTAVQFTDTSFSSAPGGVLTWSWDFGDGSAGSSVQNPSHTYTCGVFSPKLTVLDATGFHTKTYTDLISVGVVEADCSAGGTFGVAPYMVNFSDTSTGGPTSWLWDFGDGGTSTSKDPSHVYVTGGKFTVKLTATGQCNNHTVTKVDMIEVCASNAPNSGSISTLFTGGNGLTAAGCGNLFEVQVANPNGIKVTSLDINTRAAVTTSVGIDVYITPGDYLANQNNSELWVKVSTGNGASAGGLVATNIDVDDFYLAPGKYGVYVVYLSGGTHYTNGNGTNQSYQNCDLKIDLGVSKNTIFSGSAFNPRIWNGSIHYSTNDVAGNGRFGYGCAGSNAAIGDLSMDAEPMIGGTGNFTVTGTPNVPVAPGFLFIGITKQLMDLTPLGMAGCFLHTDMLLTLGIASMNGTATQPFGIPNNPAVVGAQALMQAAIVDPGANGLGVSVTNGLSMRIGN
jgi:PKD repeat protein